MKTNKIKIFFSIISFCFLVTSCNNLLSELTQQKTYIQISTNLDNTNQRTVLPDFSVVQGQGYTWQLYNGDTLLQTWTDANGKSAYQNMCESKIEVDPGSYSFELKVIKDDKIILKSESQTVQIEQNKNNDITFVLCPPTENEAKGSVNFKITFPNEKVNIVEAKLFEPGDDGKEVAVGDMPEVVISQTDSSSTANITVTNVPAGSYLLRVDLCYQVGEYSSTETINTYTTIVQVAAGFCSKAKVTLEELTDYYTITYMVDDDIITTFKESNVIPTTFKKNSNVGLPIAYNDGQLSIGWFNDPECMSPVELNDDKFTITENTTLYTQWGNVVNTNDLSFDTIDTANNIKGLLIQNETGLNYFRNIVNGTLNENIIVSDNVVYRRGTPYPTVNAKLCDDIVLSNGSDWVPIGYYKEDDNKAYNGIFDGNGKCVTNLKITPDSTTDTGIAFFGAIQDATIKNLYVSGEINGESLLSIGGIVGEAYGNSSIYNCVNNIQINNNNTSRSIGGILGWLDSNSIVQINSCVNIAPINNNYSVAGILGYGSSNVTIKNCLNLGKITKPSENLNAVAGIANIFGDPEKSSSVTSCINASSIQGKDEDDNIYPIVCIASSYSTATLLYNYYNSTILPTDTVTTVVSVAGATSSDLDKIVLDDWENTESDSQYPIPKAIKDTFEESFCWEDIILEAANIEASSGYVSGAYFVNGDDGDDNINDGSSIDKPYKKLTTAITKAIASEAKTVYVSGTLTPSNQEVTNPSTNQEPQNSVFYVQDNDFNGVVEIIGVSENTYFSGDNATRIFSTLNACNFKMKNINFINGKTVGSGAAIYLCTGSLELDSCKISGNVSTTTLNGDGIDGIYTYGRDSDGRGSELKMTNTTCEDSIYLYATTATIGSNCTIGRDNTAPDAISYITLDESTLILNGQNIVIIKPIYVKNRISSIQIGDDYYPGEPITIKLASSITDDYNNSAPYTLVSECNGTKSNYFTIECEDSTKTATLDANGKITVSSN